MRHGLGPFRFDVRNAPLVSLKRDSDFRWAAQERALRAPGMQFLGPGEDQISLAATIYPLVLSPGGINQIAGLRAAARTGDQRRTVAGDRESELPIAGPSANQNPARRHVE